MMNDRIRELAEQAAKYSATMFLPTGENGDELFVKKFAELIVAECCVALHPMLQDMISMTQAVDMIVDHFRSENKEAE